MSPTYQTCQTSPACTESAEDPLASAAAQAIQLTVSEREKLRAARITGYNEAMSGVRLLAARNGTVRTGIDVLEGQGFADLRQAGKDKTRVALVTNHTGVDARGVRTIDLLAKAPGLELAAIFSPEHGVAGAMDTTAIGDSKDASTGVPVVSVYGDTAAKRHPSPKVLAGADVIVYDIQDIGVRFYTYETTLGYFLEAAAKAGKPIVVLDRPNPINGAFVQGPISDPGREDFIDFGQVPIRHGMTIGELARFYNAERGIHAQLSVIAMEGWQRGDWLDSTGVLWINPSPNVRNLTEAALYPGLGILESTNVSLGRGTHAPFERVGAPWVHPAELAATLNARAIAGVRFVPEEFIPSAGADLYPGQKCGGVNIIVTDRNTLDSPELGLEIASALQSLYPNQFETKNLDHLMKNAATAKAIEAGVDPRRPWMDCLKPEAAQGACIGVAGSGVPQVRQAIHEILREILSCPINVVGDQEIAHESVFKGAPGVIVISGTGSIAFGRNGTGIQARAGGHGLIVGDEGSGHWIGRTAISACLRALDRGSEPELLAAIVKAFGCATVRDLIQAANTVPLAPFASLLPLIDEASESGDAIAVEVLIAAAGELASIAGTVAARLQMTDAFCVAMAGGVFEHSSVVRQSFAEALQAKHPGGSVKAQLADPLRGALALAARPVL